MWFLLCPVEKCVYVLGKDEVLKGPNSWKSRYRIWTCCWRQSGWSISSLVWSTRRPFPPKKRALKESWGVELQCDGPSQMLQLELSAPWDRDLFTLLVFNGFSGSPGHKACGEAACEWTISFHEVWHFEEVALLVKEIRSKTRWSWLWSYCQWDKLSAAGTSLLRPACAFSLNLFLTTSDLDAQGVAKWHYLVSIN